MKVTKRFTVDERRHSELMDAFKSWRDSRNLSEDDTFSAFIRWLIWRYIEERKDESR